MNFNLLRAYQLILEGKYDSSGVFGGVSNNREQDYAKETHGQTPSSRCFLQNNTTNQKSALFVKNQKYKLVVKSKTK